MTRHLTLRELDQGLPGILASPHDAGALKAIVVRPKPDERISLERCEVSPALGVHGDAWARGCWLSLPDGRPHPDVQIAMMNARAIALMAQHPARWRLAGDNLYVDMELSDQNLPCGQRLGVGTAVLEITAQAHNGCKKFAARFGADAVKFVNSADGKKLHLRGIYAKVVQAGIIQVGDEVKKL